MLNSALCRQFVILSLFTPNEIDSVGLSPGCDKLASYRHLHYAFL